MFNFLKQTFKKIYNQFTAKINVLFSRETLDEETLKQLELLLISSDTGVKTTRIIIENLKAQWKSGKLTKGSDLKVALEKELLAILQANQFVAHNPIYLMVGINGSGKTTFTGKLAHLLHCQGKKVLLVAADTFRAAAPEQLAQWADRTQSSIYIGKEGQDPASVVFAGCEKYKNEGFDALIIDTAGRLQTKSNLMKELEKIKKIITRQLPNKEICTLLTVDSMLGQNSLEQAILFNESTKLNGVVLTKMDGTGKGGIIFAIAQQLSIPIAYTSYGEQMDQVKSFDAQSYVHELIHG